MLKEIKEELKFAIENPILTLIVIGTFTGILPSFACGILYKVLSF